MKQFDSNGACPKCGCKLIGTKFVAFGAVHCGRIRRDCERCGFVWYERPLDEEISDALPEIERYRDQLKR